MPVIYKCLEWTFFGSLYASSIVCRSFRHLGRQAMIPFQNLCWQYHHSNPLSLQEARVSQITATAIIWSKRWYPYKKEELQLQTLKMLEAVGLFYFILILGLVVYAVFSYNLVTSLHYAVNTNLIGFLMHDFFNMIVSPTIGKQHNKIIININYRSWGFIADLGVFK